MPRRQSLEIGRRIQRLRLALGLTQEEIARRSRITAKFLSAVENGHSNPTVDVFMRIVELGLEMPLARFFGGEVDSDDDAIVRALLVQMTPAARHRALRVLKALGE